MIRRIEPEDPGLKSSYVAKYFERDRTHPLNSLYDALDEDFKGVRQNSDRSKTNKFCCWIIILLFIGTIPFLAASVRRYDLSILEYGQDFRGDYCGQSYLISKPYVYWPNPQDWGIYVKACVTTCPTSANQEICLYDQWNEKLVEGYCQLTYETKLDPTSYNCLPTSDQAKADLIYAE